jgi:WD40 repeat protein
MTDEDGKSNFCSAVTGGVMEDKLIVCAVIDDHCHIFLAKRSKEGEIALEKKCEFKADFNQSTDFASVNTVLLGSRFIITGGEDGICKMWSISVEDDDSDVWTAKLVREMKGHEGPIMALSRHPTRPWVVTASKDGTCRMFDASNGQGERLNTCYCRCIKVCYLL